MYRTFLKLSVLLAFAATSRTAEAAGAPAQLRGKNLQISWTDNRVEKIVSSGRERPVTQSSNVLVYVSAEGRFFSKFGRTAGYGFVNSNEVSGGNRNMLSWRAQGGTLSADQHFMKGARRLIVTFDGSFTSCSLRVLHGKETGSANIEYLTMTNKEPVILQSISVTSATCSIATGNPFAS